MKTAIENALYARTEFFGSNAIVPFPTAQAREHLAKIAEIYPNQPEIYLKLSELDEKLEDFKKAEQKLQKYVELQADKLFALNELETFYNRRGEFAKQAEILNKMLELAPKERRGEYFANLINLAKTHKLENYLKPEFYQQIIAHDASTFSILEQYLDKLIEEKNYEEAAKFITESREKFSEKKEYFIKKQVSILLVQNKKKEAENVYYEAFEPSWSDELTEQFYSFLYENDRFRSYGNELKKKFKANPANFDAAIRLVHFQKYDGDSSENVILRLENARAKEKIEWQADELLTVSLFLISDGNADSASRFLYALFLKNEAKKGGELRAKILYQLFALLSDAENERLALTKGDLNFYRDIASSDTNPGITTGILSLIFADENPRRELEKKEENAVKLFNRAAAFRIFSEYKKEFPATAELAQMYLDIARLYIHEKDFEIARNTLAEFEERFKNSAEFPNIALKLADAYTIAGKFEKEREVYQQILDHFGSQRNIKNPLISDFGQNETDFSALNKGINIPTEKDENSEDYYAPPKIYNDFISQNEPQITYKFVLNRYVSSLAREKKTQEILALYNNEISKYSDEEALYEDFLIWLGQTNFTAKELEIYNRALGKFQNKTWQDKLARWYIKNQRKEEFGELSGELIGQFGDEETQEYLWTFMNDTVLANPKSFDGKLYYALYLKAHERFPHNQTFVGGLLKYFQATKQTNEWKKLMAEYYFEMPEIRKEFLTYLSKRGELRKFYIEAGEKIGNDDSIKTLPYRLFRADASAHLSNFEESVIAYRELNCLYPNTSEFSERLINFTRSLGQTSRKILTESAEITHEQAEFLPVSAEYRTRAGELQAELGDYERAGNEWQKLILTAKGEPQIYLDTATVFWDYFQYDDALKTLENLRSEMKNKRIYAFQTGAIYEAKGNKINAIDEYIKQLGANTSDENILSNISQTKRRLVQLSKKEDFRRQIKNAFEKERKNGKENSALVLNYTYFLVKSEQNAEAVNLLNKEVARSNSEEFLLEAKLHYENLENKAGERSALKQLAKTAESKKNAISYQLRLAEDFSETGKNQNAADILADLTKKYPTNFGVLTEADEFYWRIGKRATSLQILQSGVKRGRGNFKYIFERKLASRYISLNRFREAEQILVRLHNENKGDTEVFDELANIYVRERKPELLRKIAGETIKSLKENDLDSRELNYETAEWRGRLINSFTRLEDYDSAIEQHIEIINSQPDSEERVEDAIRYVRRYGGAEKLVGFYKKLADNAYKNYRWTLVLGRIFEANKDYAKAAENYKLAIHNQPEMVELYAALAGVYAKDKKIDRAIETIDKVLELTHDAPNYLKRKIEILENAGRTEEAEIVREKLTGIKKSEDNTARKDFAEAAILSETENLKAIEKYRNAFAKVSENPLDSELQAADIIGYINAVWEEDNLDEIAKRLWNLREKLIADFEDQTGVNAGKVQILLAALDSGFAEGIGDAATKKATGNELENIYRDIENRIGNSKNETDKFQTFSLLENLIDRCGFFQLKEKILIARKDEAFELENFSDYHNRLNLLLDYYEQNGDFGRVLEVLENESKRDNDAGNFEYQQKIADVSEILGNREKQLQALKHYFESPKKVVTGDDFYVGHYLEIIYSGGKNGRAALGKMAQSQSQHQLQIINFFIANDEKNLAHLAIENASFAKIWKQTKNAEISLALSEFEDEKAGYFQSALQFAPIGELVGQKPDAQTKLVGDDWFRLTYKFGNWLKLNPDENRKESAEKYLPAMTENRPKDANEQSNLGVFYLQNNDFPRSVEHLEIAHKMHMEDKNIRAKLGIAYFQLGEIEKADEIWNSIIAGDDPTLEDCELYFETLREYGQAGKAQGKLLPIIAKFIRETPDENPAAVLLIFLRKISDSFSDENEKTGFWLKLSKDAAEKMFAAKYVVEKSLVEENRLEKFYQILIERSANMDAWTKDYEYVQLLEMNWSAAEAERILDQETNFKIEEPDNERLNWQKEYLGYLLEKREFSKAESLISDVEKSLRKTFASPVWLRVAKFQIEIEKGISPENFSRIKSFIGINDVLDAKQINPPNLERLNEIIKLLRAKSFDAKILDLREAFYARSLAIEKYNLSNFKGLIDAEFEKGETENALELLDLMMEISFEATSDKALAKFHSLKLIKKFAPENPELFEILPENKPDGISALKLAAEISVRFGQINSAINFRRKLLIVAPKDNRNKIELVRLLAFEQNFDEAIKYLSATIADRNATRNERWQAVFVSGEIIGNDENLWKILKNNLPDLKAKDSEMWKAVEAISSAKTGNSAEALRILTSENGEFQTAQILFLQAIIAKNFKQNETALKAFAEIKNQPFDFEKIFGFVEEKPVFQMIRLYSDGGKPRAALKIAESNESLKFAENELQISNFKFQTLAERAAENYEKSLLEILGILSNDAEIIGDFSKAIEFEERRFGLLSGDENLQNSRNHIAELERKIYERSGNMKIDFRVDGSLAAR